MVGTHTHSGITVPEKRQGLAEEGKKKVVYVSRQRKNKRKQDTNDETSTGQLDAGETPSSSLPSEQPGDEVRHISYNYRII